MRRKKSRSEEEREREAWVCSCLGSGKGRGNVLPGHFKAIKHLVHVGFIGRNEFLLVRVGPIRVKFHGFESQSLHFFI